MAERMRRYHIMNEGPPAYCKECLDHFHLEDLAVGLMRPPLNIDIER
jgi:hypothetical protein